MAWIGCVLSYFDKATIHFCTESFKLNTIPYGFTEYLKCFGNVRIKRKSRFQIESKLDDILTLEVFDSKDLAESSDFSDASVEFRREPS